MMTKSDIKSSLFMFALNSLFIQHVYAHILRLPCLTYGNFSIVKNESRLTSNVLETFNDLNEDECENKCTKHRLCKSINTKNSTGVNCELISKSTEDAFDNVTQTAMAGWTFKTTNYKARNIGYLCLTKKPCPVGLTCTDSCSCPGYECHVAQLAPSSNCQEYQNKGYKTSIKPIQIPGMPIFDVQCDLETNGGGWILLQRRVDASVDFDRNWNEYKTGFGDLNGNFWLGLEKIHKLARPGKGAILRVDLKHVSKPNELRYAEYSKFEISDAHSGYKITIGGYSGNVGDSLAYSNGMKFSAKDLDQDKWIIGHCARTYKSGWWHNRCHHSSLNGLFSLTEITSISYMSWYSLASKYGGIIFSEIKIRYMNA